MFENVGEHDTIISLVGEHLKTLLRVADLETGIHALELRFRLRIAFDSVHFAVVSCYQKPAESAEAAADVEYAFRADGDHRRHVRPQLEIVALGSGFTHPSIF